MTDQFSPLDPARIQALHRVVSTAAQFSQAAPGPLTEQLAVCLAADLALSWAGPAEPQSHPLSPLQRLQLLCPFLALLRRGDQNSQWLQIQHEWRLLDSQKHQDFLASKKADDDEAFQPRRRDGGFSKETIAQMEKDLNLF